MEKIPMVGNVIEVQLQEQRRNLQASMPTLAPVTDLNSQTFTAFRS